MPTRCRNCRLDVRLLDMCGGYGDCHTPLPREVRNGKDTTPPACSLHVQGVLAKRDDRCSGPGLVSLRRVADLAAQNGQGVPHGDEDYACGRSSSCVAAIPATARSSSV